MKPKSQSGVREELDKARTIKDLWTAYNRHILPANPHPTQVQECRRAFYSGADGILQLMLALFDADIEPTAEDLLLMERLDAELVDFAEMIAKGVA